MPFIADIYADTTVFTKKYSVFIDKLNALHVSGSVLLRESYTPPWSIAVPDSGKLADLLGVAHNVLVAAFHLVEFGHCVIRPETGDAILLKGGDIAICVSGKPHHLDQGTGSSPQTIEALLAGGPNIHRPDTSNPQIGASLLCGVFTLNHTLGNPLITSLPPILKISVAKHGEMHNLSGVARMMADELDHQRPGREFIVERLLEVLSAEAIRAYYETSQKTSPGWFKGVEDPVIGQSIALMHEEPSKHWSVSNLASHVAISPSRFAARFVEAVGDTPMAYLTKWRMNLACRELETTRLKIDQIANSVGYDNIAAFSRAFKKYASVSPTTWRARNAR